MVTTTTEAQNIARRRVDEYFDALVREIPFDTAPGDVDLIAAAIKIEEALAADSTPDDRTAAHDAGHRAIHAGYLLGIEVGRRLGGAR
jgi:hypothetical protein